MNFRNKWLLPACLLALGILLLPVSICARSEWSRTRPQINLTHIFKGEINRKGRPVGFHSRPGGRDPETARMVKIVSPPNRAGVYTARVEIWDKRTRRWKQKFSSFFPDKMSRKEVIKAILHAYKHREHPRKQPWIGPSGSGFVIQGYLNKRGNINTAFPVYIKDRNNAKRKKKKTKIFYR